MDLWLSSFISWSWNYCLLVVGRTSLPPYPPRCLGTWQMLEAWLPVRWKTHRVPQPLLYLLPPVPLLIRGIYCPLLVQIPVLPPGHLTLLPLPVHFLLTSQFEQQIFAQPCLFLTYLAQIPTQSSTPKHYSMIIICKLKLNLFCFILFFGTMKFKNHENNCNQKFKENVSTVFTHLALCTWMKLPIT